MVQLAPLLRDCMKRLTVRARRIVKMRYVDGLSAAKVAEIMGSQVEAIYQSLWRIHRTLGKCVERQSVHGRVGGMEND